MAEPRIATHEEALRLLRYLEHAAREEAGIQGIVLKFGPLEHTSNGIQLLLVCPYQGE